MKHGGSPLRVYAVGRPDAEVAPGGGEVQMASTVAALGALGVAARAWRSVDNEVQQADCIHLFGSRPEHLPVVEAARRRGVPTVLSTIAWFDWTDYWRGGSSPVGRVAAVARFAARAACPRLPSWRRRLYHAVDLLLPNSTAEAAQLIRYFGVPPERIRVVPNGADPRFAKWDGQPFVDRFGAQGFVLCPGRIEPRKNQLGLIRAMRGSDVPLVILGQAVPRHEPYLEACRREAGESVRFLDRLDHDDPMLGAAYAACGCLALASWFETPGLVALEAGMSGTPLVLPAGGAALEYFGPYAQYVKPRDYRAIRRAVVRALDGGRSRALADHVRENFSWDAVARATLEAYEAVICPGDGPLLRSTDSANRLPVDRGKGRSPSTAQGWHALRNEGRVSIAPPRPSFLRACHPAARLRRRTLGRYRYVRLRWRVLFAGIDFVGGLVFGAGRLAGQWAKVFRRPWGATGVSPVHVRRAHGQDARGTSTPDDPRTILIIQLDHLGDAILSTGMISVLRRRYPHSSIEVLTGEWNRDLFDAMDDVDRVHVSRLNRFSRAGRFGWPLAVFWWGWRLRRRRIDLGIDVRGEFPQALLLWLCGARRRLGWAAGGGGFLLTDSPEFVPNRPETESRGDLLAQLGIPVERPEQLWPVFRCPEPVREGVRRQLERQGLGQRFVAVHVAAGTAAKQWPAAHWRTLVGRLVLHHGLEVVLVGTSADRIIAQSILADDGLPGAHDWTGRCSIGELAALLEQAAVVVGADSGPVHLAAAVGRPVVVLASGTNGLEQWQPRGRHVTVLRHPLPCSPCHRSRCPRDDHPCMRRLRPEDVVAAVLETLPGMNLTAKTGRVQSPSHRCRSGNELDEVGPRRSGP